MSSVSPPLFNVTRRDPTLVVPSKPIPREIKPLSVIDDQQALRCQVPVLFFYKSDPSMAQTDPVKLIRGALVEALVFYYPFAGRLVERPNDRLVVDCTSEIGVLFVEADADARVDRLIDTVEFGWDTYVEELLHSVPDSDGIIGCPLLLFQVTRFRCGGFTLGVRFNHAVTDASGMAQFVNGIVELARGEKALSLSPVWQRKYFLTAREPPRVTCQHVEFEEIEDLSPKAMTGDGKNSVHRFFYFGPNDLRALRSHLPEQQRKQHSQFDVLAAFLWRCRTRALELDPNQTVRFSCVANGRYTSDLKVPHGYYGNVIAYPCVSTESKILCSRPLGYAAYLVKEAKARMSGEYIRSVADHMIIKGNPLVDMKWNFIVSDSRGLGVDEVDFGWGRPILAGVARTDFTISSLMRFRGGIATSLSMPEPVMERFQEELKKVLKQGWLDQLQTRM